MKCGKDMKSKLDCEGIDISAEKGKVNIVDIPGFEDTVDEVNSIK